MSTSKSKKLAKLFPEFFQQDGKYEIELLKRCLTQFEEIEQRYSFECNTHIVKRQVVEINETIALIKKHLKTI